MKRLFILMLLLVPFSLFADTFVEGVDYKLVAKSALTPTSKAPSVTEFFSYGCPWCYKLEPKLEAWRQTLPKTIIFKRVPVVFEAGWDLYAKAYYTAKTLNRLDTLSPALFDAIQEKRAALKSSASMIAFFVKHGVEAPIAKSAFTSSPAIDTQVKQGMQLMQAFGISSVPTLIINNTYRIDLQLAKGSQTRLLAIADYLLKLKTKSA
jgi:thiol:disulfide interchange protein DsbA